MGAMLSGSVPAPAPPTKLSNITTTSSYVMLSNGLLPKLDNDFELVPQFTYIPNFPFLRIKSSSLYFPKTIDAFF